MGGGREERDQDSLANRCPKKPSLPSASQQSEDQRFSTFLPPWHTQQVKVTHNTHEGTIHGRPAVGLPLSSIQVGLLNCKWLKWQISIYFGKRSSPPFYITGLKKNTLPFNPKMPSITKSTISLIISQKKKTFNIIIDLKIIMKLWFLCQLTTPLGTLSHEIKVQSQFGRASDSWSLKLRNDWPFS